MWKFFRQDQFPKNGQEVTVIWNDGAETDCVWESAGIDWNSEIVPVCWKLQ